MTDLKDFGWNPTQSISDQTAAVLSALDSGEPLTFMGTVQVNQPLVMDNCPSLVGYGADVTITATAASQIVCDVPEIDTLTILRDHAILSDINFHRNGTIAQGSAVVVGNQTKKCLGVKIDGISSHPFNRHGIHVRAMAKSNIDRSWISGGVAAIRWENLHGSDDGDNSMVGCRVLGHNDGIGLHWTSGGGLYIGQSKFLFGQNHIYIDWNTGGSGNFSLVGCSLESCNHISVDMRGSFPFKRMQIAGNTWGGVLLAIAVRNFSPIAWLELLNVTGNTADTELGAGVPIFDIGCTQHAFIGSNVLRGYGNSHGIITRPGSSGMLGKNNISGCASPVVNQAGWT